MLIKFFRPACSSEYLNSPDESVTALLIFFLVSSSESRIKIKASLFVSDLDIFEEGSLSDIILAPTFGVKISGIVKVSEYLELNLCAKSLVISICCFWSSPTGT